MLPDILGFSLDEGIDILHKSGFCAGDIIINEYFSPKRDIIGNTKRIVRVDNLIEKIILTVSYF